MNDRTKLYELRKRKKLSVRDLSQRTGVSPKVIRAMERGDQSVDIKSVLILARRFKISTEALMSICEGGERG